MTKIGVVWYRREGYPRFLSISADPEVLEPDYDSWLGNAAKGMNEISNTGINVERVYLDPDVFIRWWKQRSLRLDAKARSSFVSDFVAGEIPVTDPSFQKELSRGEKGKPGAYLRKFPFSTPHYAHIPNRPLRHC